MTEEKITLAKVIKDRGLMTLDDNKFVSIPVIPTGILSLDLVLGCGGVPRGRIIELYGPESSGKSTLAQEIIAQAQSQSLKCAYIDAEHCLDRAYAKALGVDTEQLLIQQPDCGEEALDTVRDLIATGEIGLIVVDSVAALVPKAELEGEMGDASMGVQARLMSKMCRMLTATIEKTGTTVIFINQIRMKIGVMFGNPETTTGGTALKYYAAQRLEIRKITNIKKGEEITGHRTRIKVVKNKIAAPHRETEVDLIFGKGIDSIKDIADLAVELKIIDRSGAWYSFEGKKIGQGIEQVREQLVDNPDLHNQIKTLCMQTVVGVPNDQKEA